ncbi:hypothetical protein JKP88DRAFT_255469 [Tribonema minus]|uniref:Uncharacterized protein n=1 Tax=Tribonema minus TaxID=303371 RepID=A0A835Z2J5_9STRA|nr:hypothetical protein JKP88DRAFT_255469 [Tribonema minus]
MWGELLHPARRHQRFSRFRAQQAAIAKMAETLAPIRLQHRPPGWKCVRSRGREFSRRKRKHRRVARHAQEAPLNHLLRRMCALPRRRPRRHSHQEIGGAAGMPVSDIDDATAIQFRLVPGAAEGGVAVIDRDTNALANLGMRGVYATCGVDVIIPGYVPADQEEEEDTEEGESDEEDGDEEDGDEEDDEEEDGEEGGDVDEGGDGAVGGVDDGEGGGDEEGVDEEWDAIMA